MALRETDRVYEELLLTLLQAGDPRAAARLVARWQPRLLRTARPLLRDEDEAHEATQEAWAGITRGWLRIGDSSRFPAWAFGVLHHKCADRIRANRRRRTGAGQLAVTAPATAAPRIDDRIAIAQALDVLSPEHREAAILYFGEGLTAPEIAQATGVAAETVKSRIFHARRQLQAALTGDVHDKP